MTQIDTSHLNHNQQRAAQWFRSVNTRRRRALTVLGLAMNDVRHMDAVFLELHTGDIKLLPAADDAFHQLKAADRDAEKALRKTEKPKRRTGLIRFGS